MAAVSTPPRVPLRRSDCVCWAPERYESGRASRLGLRIARDNVVTLPPGVYGIGNVEDIAPLCVSGADEIWMNLCISLNPMVVYTSDWAAVSVSRPAPKDNPIVGSNGGRFTGSNISVIPLNLLADQPVTTIKATSNVVIRRWQTKDDEIARNGASIEFDGQVITFNFDDSQ